MAELTAMAWVAEDRNGDDAAYLLLTPTFAGHEASVRDLAVRWGLASNSDAVPFATVTAYVSRLMLTVEGVRLAVRRRWSSLARSRGQVVLIIGPRPLGDAEDAVTYAPDTPGLYRGLASVAATG
jgi:hypothetical protein